MNLQKDLEKLLPTAKGKTLLLHSCCAPCSSYVLEYLSEYFVIQLFFYNPNIMPSIEYDRRLEEVKHLLSQLNPHYPITLLEGNYDTKKFLEAVKGMEEEPEGGARCTVCYEMRLREAAIMAKKTGADYFTTTLSISPYKNAEKLDTIAQSLEEEYGVQHLPSDFKKKGGYQRSIELSLEYDLYRQDYCGCAFSKALREAQKRAKEQDASL